jgi:hypothetical protein
VAAHIALRTDFDANKVAIDAASQLATDALNNAAEPTGGTYEVGRV